MEIVDLIGCPLTVGVESTVMPPAEEFRAVPPQISGAQSLSPIEVDGLGSLPGSAPFPVGRLAVWGMGHRSDLADPSKGVKKLGRSDGEYGVWPVCASSGGSRSGDRR